MYEGFIAKNKDLEAIEEALDLIKRPKMKFVFSDFSRIKNTHVISYDSKYVYLWQIKPIKLVKISHNLIIFDEWQSAWRTGIQSKEIEKFLPKKIKNATRFKIPIISGGFLTPFINLQKQKDIQYNPYVTEESYLATITHEFGHVYWNSFKLWWPSNLRLNLQQLNLAYKLYTRLKLNGKLSLSFPVLTSFGEIFAFCTEYYLSSIFLPSHKKMLDKFAKYYIKKISKEEAKKDLEREDSTIDPHRNPHNFALVFGKILMQKYPKTWPIFLTKNLQVTL